MEKVTAKIWLWFHGYCPLHHLKRTWIMFWWWCPMCDCEEQEKIRIDRQLTRQKAIQKIEIVKGSK